MLNPSVTIPSRHRPNRPHLSVNGLKGYHTHVESEGVFALACLVAILGLLAATDSLGRHFAAGEPGVGAKTFYAIPIADMLVFSTLIYFAFRERFNPAAHKRLIVIATITLLDAAFVRWPIPAAWWDLPMAQMCCYPLLLLLIGYDLWSTGKIQRATLWASVFLIVLQQVRSPIGRTIPWQSFATWVQNLARSFHSAPKQLAGPLTSRQKWPHLAFRFELLRDSCRVVRQPEAMRWLANNRLHANNPIA